MSGGKSEREPLWGAVFTESHLNTEAHQLISSPTVDGWSLLSSIIGSYVNHPFR